MEFGTASMAALREELRNAVARAEEAMSVGDHAVAERNYRDVLSAASRLHTRTKLINELEREGLSFPK